MFMIGMQNKNSQLKTKGFVLAEAIFSLFVTMLVLFILQNLLLSVKKANLSENQHMNEVAYAYVQLDRYMYDEDTKMVYPLVNEGKAKSATFVKVNKDKSEVEYKIEYYLSKRVLKVSKSSGGGYMPLIFNVQSAKFITRKDKIIIRINEYNKGESDLVFQLDEEPDEDRNVRKNKKEDQGKRKRAIQQHLSINHDIIVY